jgi:hypothetical protein
VFWAGPALEETDVVGVQKVFHDPSTVSSVVPSTRSA